MEATDVNEDIIQSLPQMFTLRIALRSSNILNETLVAKFTFESSPGLYPKERIALEKLDILSRSLPNFTYVFQPVPPMDSAQLSTVQYILPLCISVCMFVSGTVLFLWMKVKIMHPSLIVKRCMLMLVGALLLNVVYAATSTFELNVVSCSSLHVLSSLILSIVSR
jgi:hypothetical protein